MPDASLNMIFSLDRTAVAWSIVERISGLNPSLDSIDIKYLKFSTVSSP